VSLFGALLEPWAHSTIRTTDELVRHLAGQSTSEAGESVSIDSALRVSTVLACQRVLAEGVAQLPLKLYREAKSGKKEPATAHPLYNVLWRRPNEWMSSFEWRETSMYHAGLAQGAFAYVNKIRGQTTEVLPFVPGNVTVRQAEDHALTYEVRGSKGIIGEFPREQVFHLRGPSWNGYQGLQMVRQAREAIGLAMATEKSQALLHKNGARPSGVLMFPTSLEEEQKEAIAAAWLAAFGGGNQFGTAVMDLGAKYERMAMTGVDAQHLECVVPGTLVTMADGTRRLVEDLRIGDVVVGWLDGPVAARVSAVGRPPAKELVRITTSRGRVLACSTDHPVLALASLRTAGSRPTKEPPGWISAGALRPGNYMRVGLGHAARSNGLMTSDIAWFLGAMVGDGYIRTGGCALSATDPGVIAKTRRVVEDQGGSLSRCTSNPNDFAINTGGSANGQRGNPLRHLFNASALVGSHSHTKRVPDIVMSAGPDAWRAFLSGYLDTDGTIGKGNRRSPLVSWSSTSRALLEDCQHLLAMLGVQSGIYAVGHGGRRIVCGQECNTRPSWQMVVYGGSQLSRLATLLSPAHSVKAGRLAMLAGSPPSKYRPVNFEFDRVVSVEALGPGETVGVEIEGVHTHITNGLVTHNTRKHQVEEICRIFRVFPLLVGYSDKTATFASAEQFFGAHVIHSLGPWIERFEQAIDRDLLSEKDRREGYFAKFNVNGLLRGDAAARAAYFKAMLGTASSPGWGTPNDVRRLEDMDPSDDPAADELLTVDRLTGKAAPESEEKLPAGAAGR
jgi:phage portal protein BeeE